MSWRVGGFMKYFLAFDVGTTSMKCILYDMDFNEVFVDNEEYSLLTPENNVVEIESDTYFDVFIKSVKKIWDEGINPDDVLSITFTTQGETLVAVDESGKALTNAIVWLDSRAEEEAEFIKSKISPDEFYSVTGLGGIDGALPMAKLMWLLRNKPDVYEKTHKFLLLEDYLIFKLSGKFVTEMSLLSSTGWFNIVNEKYHKKFLDICNISEEKLPDILHCGERIGNVAEEAAKLCGLSTDTVLVSGAMDQVASAIGAGNICEGVVTETTGTALVVGATVKEPDFSSNIKTTVYKHFDDKFLYMPYCPTAGIVLKWFKDTLMGELKAEAEKHGKSSYTLIDELAEEANPGCDGVMCLPHFSGKDGAENVKGAFVGITLKTGKAELSRSVLEGIACMLNEQIEILLKTGLEIKEIRSLGGGSYSDIWAKIKASVCNVDIVRTKVAQSTALGAAILGAVALGVYPSVEEAHIKVVTDERITKPVKEETLIYKEVYKEYNKYYEVLSKKI